MEITLVFLLGLLLGVTALSTALCRGYKALGHIVARERSMRPQTRYYIG